MLKHISGKKIILFLGDVSLIIASFYLSYAIRHDGFVNVFAFRPGASILYILILLFILYVGNVYGSNDWFIGPNFAIRFAITIIVATSLIAAAFYIINPWQYSRIAFVLNTIFIFTFLLFWRFVFDRYFIYFKAPNKVLIIGAGRAGRTAYGILEKNDDYEIVGFLDDDVKKKGMVIGSSEVIGTTELFPSLVKNRGIEKAIVAITDNASTTLLEKVMNAKFNGIDIYDMPTLYENITGRIPISHTSHSWFGYADFYGVRKNLYNTNIKGILDKIVAVFILIFTFPLIIVAILAIKLDSKGPVFFIQERRGEGRNFYKIIKLRTMIQGMEKERKFAVHENDMRITRVGKVLRFFRIDEIPQLWNVIMGHMSIVGPRSLIREEVEEFSKQVPYFFLRHSVKPGITGWAQVNYKHGTEIIDATEKLQYDLYYIKNLSPFLDFLILLKTMSVVLFGKGAR